VKARLICVFVILLFLFPVLLATVPEPEAQETVPSAGGKVIIKDRFKFMNKKGGCDVWVTLEGDVAKELRRRLDNSAYGYHVRGVGGNGSGMVEGYVDPGGPLTEVNVFAETFEDRMEKGDPYDSAYTDLVNSSYPYDGTYTGLDIASGWEGERLNADVQSLDGLRGDVDSDEPITIYFRARGSAADRDQFEITDSHVILYCIFNGAFDVDVEKDYQIITVGFQSRSNPSNVDGSFRKIRFGVGEWVTFEDNFNSLDDPHTSVEYSELSILESPPILLVVMLGFGAATVMVPRSFARREQMLRIRWLHGLAGILFMGSFVLYVLGLPGMLVWISSISFVLLMAVLSYLFYVRDIGKMNESDQLQTPSQWHSRGVRYFKKKDYENAISCFDNSLEINPKDAVVWNDKGYALYMQGKFKSAIKCFNNAIKIDPKYVVAKENLKMATDAKDGK